MANPLTTAELEATIVEVLPVVQKETSVLTRAGASNVSYNTDIVQKLSLGGPAAVEEGNLKPKSDVSIANFTVVKHVLSYILLQTEQFQDTPEGRELTANALQDAVGNMVKGFDILVLNGTNPQTGTAFTPAAAVNLKDNASEHLAAGTAATAEEIKDIIAATSKAKAVVLSDKGLNAIQFSETASGLRAYPEASRNSSFDFWGVGAHHSDALGLNGWSDVAEFTNKNVAVTGDFSKIGRSYGTPRVKLFTEALGGVILGDYNQIGYRIEVPVAYYVQNPESFSILKTS